MTDRFKCMCFVIIIERDYLDFCCFRAITQQPILHLAVNWKVFTINPVYVRPYTEDQSSHSKSSAQHEMNGFNFMLVMLSNITVLYYL